MLAYSISTLLLVRVDMGVTCEFSAMFSPLSLGKFDDFRPISAVAASFFVFLTSPWLSFLGSSSLKGPFHLL